MKRLICAAALIFSVCAVIGLISAGAKPQADVSDCCRTYIFRSYNGVVACFEEGEEKPFLVTSRKISDLPPLDRIMLAAGVEVVGARAMTRTLEDLTS